MFCSLKCYPLRVKQPSKIVSNWLQLLPMASNLKEKLETNKGWEIDFIIIMKNSQNVSQGRKIQSKRILFKNKINTEYYYPNQMQT